MIQLSDHFTYKRLRFVLAHIFMMIFCFIHSVVDGLFISDFADEDAFAAVFGCRRHLTFHSGGGIAIVGARCFAPSKTATAT